MEALHTGPRVLNTPSAIFATEALAMVKHVDIDVARLAQFVGYNPATGEFIWLKTASSRAQTGSVAGTWLKMSNGKDYLNITLDGRKLSAAQIAVALQTRVWPDRSVFFVDGDTRNLKFSNLKLADHKAERVMGEDGKIRYRTSAEQVRHYGLRRNYGLTITEYAQMFSAQNGLCAICGKPETHKIPGRVSADPKRFTRDMSVDHDHKTGAIRDLLCNGCNHMLGASGDSAEVLRAAADYLDAHAVKLKDVPE